MTDVGDRKVKRAYSEWQGAISARDKFMEQHQALFEEFENILDDQNRKRDRLERVCREEGIGIGPITVNHRNQVKFDGEYLWGLFEDDPDIRDELVEIDYKIKRPVFDRLVTDGRIKRAQAARAILEEKQVVALSGVPTKAQIL